MNMTVVKNTISRLVFPFQIIHKLTLHEIREQKKVKGSASKAKIVKLVVWSQAGQALIVKMMNMHFRLNHILYKTYYGWFDNRVEITLIYWFKSQKALSPHSCVLFIISKNFHCFLPLLRITFRKQSLTLYKEGKAEDSTCSQPQLTQQNASLPQNSGQNPNKIDIPAMSIHFTAHKTF